MTREGWSVAIENGRDIFERSPHKKAIIAFANGAQIEWRDVTNRWATSPLPQKLSFKLSTAYRVNSNNDSI